MRTAPVIGVVLSLGVAFALLAGSGIGPAVFGESPGDAESASTLEEIGDEAAVDEEGVSADVAGDNEPTLVGFALSGGQFVVQTVGAVALLPITLTRLGFPSYFAVPAGAMAQIVAVIGLFQFLRTGEFI
jgi:hypothetical protein